MGTRDCQVFNLWSCTSAFEALQSNAVSARWFCRQAGREDDEEEGLADRVFEQAYIPRRLEEIEEYERDHDRLAGGLTCTAAIAICWQKVLCGIMLCHVMLEPSCHPARDLYSKSALQ